MEQWSEGVYLLGRYNTLQTGCWLLVNGKKAAILEIPPYLKTDNSPTYDALNACRKLDVSVEYLLCSHCHWDHLNIHTILAFHNFFPTARLCLQKNFQKYFKRPLLVQYFDIAHTLSLDGEVLYLIHAPKHSFSDTMVVFRGVIFTGDWELNTIRSVHDDGDDAVPREIKLASIDRMMRFESEYNYRIHTAFSVHANDRRENIDFKSLMEDTKNDRKFW